MVKTFYTLFPRAENVHLIKDVGMIPYILYEYFGYESVLATYKNSNEYSYLENEVKGLKIDFILPKFGQRQLNMAYYILKNFRKIDALQMYHFEIDQIDVIGLYMFLRRLFFLKSFTCIKCDGSSRFTDTDLSNIRFGSLRKWIIKKINLFTVETTEDYNIIKNISIYKNINLKLLPNGFDDDGKRIDLANTNKEKIILTVGRLGTHQKNTEFLLDAFQQSKVAEKGWKLYFVGPLEEKFKDYLKKFFSVNPCLSDKIEILGNIVDRELLKSIYTKSSVFILTSRAEGSPLVIPEALSCGCYCLFSNPVNLKNDVVANKEYGDVFSISSTEELVSIFNNLDNIEFNSLKYKIQNFAYEKFYWKNIVAIIDNEINQKNG